MLTKGSLCTGFGGLESALPGALRWTSEIDDAASYVLKREHPDVPNYGSLVTYPWSADDHVDLLTAGFPCQPVSAAGRQKAHDDHRWLWPDVADVIRAVCPAEIFLENVQNIRSILGGSVLRGILEDIHELGYAARWTVLGACAVGAPHHRHRWFLRGVLTGGRAPEAVEVKAKCGAPRGGGRELLPTPVVRDADYWERRAGRGKVTGMPLGAAVNLLPTPTASSYGNNQGGSAGRVGPVRHSLEPLARNALLPTPTTADGSGGPGTSPYRTGGMNLRTAALGDWGRFAGAVALWEEISGRPAPDPTVPAPKGGRRLNPALSEWMMGLPDGLLTRDCARNDALRLAGNGVVPLQARTAYDLLDN